MTRADALRTWVARPALLVAWTLVFWGTLLGGVTMVRALGDGLPSAWRALWPDRGAAPWAWLNLASVALAAVAWTLGLVALLRGRAGRPPGEVDSG